MPSLPSAAAASMAGLRTTGRIKPPDQHLRLTFMSRTPAAQKGTAFRRCNRTDLDWVFTVQTERVVAKDNTVAIGERSWQIEKSRFRQTLAGCTVMIHEHLDGRISIRYGPHVVAQFDGQNRPLGSNGLPVKAA